MRLLLASSLFVLAGLSPASARAEDPLLARFRQYFPTYTSLVQKHEAVLALDGVQDPALVDVLIPVLKETREPEVTRAVVRVFSAVRERSTADRMVTALGTEQNSQVRTAILCALVNGKHGAGSPEILGCLADKAWDVRRRALQSIALWKDPATVESVLPLCSDAEPAVRCAALDALTAIPSDAVVPKAISALSDAVWQVRSSAIRALRTVRHQDAVPALVERMQTEEGRLRDEIGLALAELTAQEHGSEAAKWQLWWGIAKEHFVLPSAESVQAARSRRPEYTFRGCNLPLPVTSHSLLFVVDVSGSMAVELAEDDRAGEFDRSPPRRIDLIRRDLMLVIDRIDATAFFDILTFNAKVSRWNGALTPANVLNRSAAKEWVQKLEADAQPMDGWDPAQTQRSQTNTLASLLAALNVPQGEKAARLVWPETKDYATEVDTIFYVSDGDPTVGEAVDVDEILARVRVANSLRKCVIHALAIGPDEKGFMRRLAEENGGAFVRWAK